LKGLVYFTALRLHLAHRLCSCPSADGCGTYIASLRADLRMTFLRRLTTGEIKITKDGEILPLIF